MIDWPSINDEIRRRADIVSEAQRAGLKPRKSGADTYHCFSPFHEEKTPSCALYQRDNSFHDYSSDKGGSIFDFVMQIQKCSFAEARDYLAAKYGVDIPKFETARRNKDTVQFAREIWVESLRADDPESEPLRLYFQNRGLDQTKIPESIRFHRGLEHPANRETIPALVARITKTLGGETSGVLRIFLTPDGKKAAVNPVKMALGELKGGAVWFDPNPGVSHCITEGIETGLAVWQATGMPTCAAVSASGMAALDVPDRVKELYIWSDREESGTGHEAARKLAERETESGRTAYILQPPGDEIKIDWLDVLVRDGAGLLMAEVERERTPYALPYRSLVCSVGEFLQRPIQPKEALIETLLFKPFLVEIFGWRGRGKSFFRDAMARSLATREDFLGRYPVTRQCYSLTIDGEMDDPDAFNRFKQFMSDSPEALERCHYLSSAETFRQLGRGFNFNHEADQKILLSILGQMEREGRRPEVLFFDNLSSLCATEENSNTEQEAYLIFFRNLRHDGYIVVFFHHAGKDQSQRGASRREDFCNLCVELAEHPSAEDGRCMFQLQFTKTRGRAPKPSRLLCELSEDPDGRLTWLTSIPEGKNQKMKWALYLKWIHDHHPTYQVEISAAHGISPQAINKQIDCLNAKGLLDGLTLTQKGQDFISRTFRQ